MSLLKTLPGELSAAAAQLEAIVSSLAAQHAGAAAATTAIAPAAADPVSLQQAALFSAYGTQYQATATQAQTEQQQYASTLNQTSATYSATEASNTAQQALDPVSLINQAYNFLSGSNGLLSPSSGGTSIGMDEMGNWASAYSDTIGMGGGGLLSAITAPEEAAGGGLGGLAGAADLAGTTTPAVGSGVAAIGATPVASMGSATMVGRLSAPPSWGGAITTVSSTTPMDPTAVPAAGWTAEAARSGPGAVIPGMPGVGAAARNSAGFGAPRYGVKPLVMPKATTV